MRFNGRHGKGYVRSVVRPLKREEAEKRNSDYQKRLKAAQLIEENKEVSKSAP